MIAPTNSYDLISLMKKWLSLGRPELNDSPNQVFQGITSLRRKGILSYLQEKGTWTALHVWDKNVRVNLVFISLENFQHMDIKNALAFLKSKSWVKSLG